MSVCVSAVHLYQKVQLLVAPVLPAMQPKLGYLTPLWDSQPVYPFTANLWDQEIVLRYCSFVDILFGQPDLYTLLLVFSLFSLHNRIVDHNALFTMLRFYLQLMSFKVC